MKKPRLISLYSGAGGLDYGFEAAGYSTSVAVEMDPTCCETLRHNRPWSVIEGDIHGVTTDAILEAGGLESREADLLIGGPPCQPFSKAGYWANGDARRLDDPRASTLQAYMRVVEEALPRAFLLENVPGLSFNGKDEGMQVLLDMIRRINQRTGSSYRPFVKQLRAADYGVPQMRERVFVVAARDGSAFRFPEPTHGDRAAFEPALWPSAGLDPYRTAWDAIGDVRPAGDEDVAVTGKWAALLPSIPEGTNYLFHTERGGGMPLFGWRRHFWTFLLKLAKNRPAWTIQAQPGPATGPFHWESRRLGMRELCRLQTFPDDVVVVGDMRAVQRQLGNAVPSLLAEVLGREIRTQLLGLGRPRKSLQLLPPVRSPVPPPEPVTRVPRGYLYRVGAHSAHPGTGKGHRAIQGNVATA